MAEASAVTQLGGRRRGVCTLRRPKAVLLLLLPDRSAASWRGGRDSHQGTARTSWSFDPAAGLCVVSEPASLWGVLHSDSCPHPWRRGGGSEARGLALSTSLEAVRAPGWALGLTLGLALPLIQAGAAPPPRPASPLCPGVSEAGGHPSP